MNKIITTLGLVGLLSTGCATKPIKRETYHLDCTIILDNQESIQKRYNAYTFQHEKQIVDGFAIPRNKSAYVSAHGVDDKGEPMPDLYTLGEEVWHLIKGDFHKQ